MDGYLPMIAGREPAEVSWPARPASTGAVIAALADAARLGEYFTIGPGGSNGAWRPVCEVYENGLHDLVEQTASRLAVTQDRVAVSIAQLGFAARLWSASLACSLRHHVVPDLRDLRISTELPVKLRLSRPRGWQAAEPGLAAGLLYRTVVEEHLEPLAAGLKAKIASGLLRGNAASAMTGALGVIASASPGLAGPARTLAELLLSTGQLRGTGGFEGNELDFRRRSCCLFYRVPAGSTCADCSLLAGPGGPHVAGADAERASRNRVR